MMKDLFTLHNELFLSSISLIPSENYSFYEQYHKKWISDISNRYCFSNNTQFSQAFPWHNYIEEIQEWTENKLKSLLNTDRLNLDAISWMNGLTTTISSFCETWNTIFLIHPKNWGHVSSSKIAKKLWLKIFFIPFKKNMFEIDYSKLRDQIVTHPPKLIYIDQMNGLYPLSLKPIEDISKQIVKFYDVSHNWVFVISKIHPSPLKDWFNCFWGSTHKTIPWPHKFFFTTNNDNIYDTYCSNARTFISNNNIFATWNLNICLDLMAPYWNTYSQNIIKNNLAFAKMLEAIWCSILSLGDYTKNHQLFWYIKNRWETELSKNFTDSWLLINILQLPFTDNTIWFRTWIQELTFLWWGLSEIKVIVSVIHNIVNWDNNTKKNRKIIQDMKMNLINNLKSIYEL